MSLKEQFYLKSHNNQKIDIEHGNFFIEYFFSIGINQDLIFEEFLYNNSLNILNESTKIKPTIISKFPPVSKINVNLDESLLIKQCFPNGFQVVESTSKPPNEVFSFNLDNLISTNNGKLYVTCLKFFENFENYFWLKEKIECSENGEKVSLNSNKDSLSRRVFKISNKSILKVDVTNINSPLTSPKKVNEVGFNKVLNKKKSVESLHLEEDAVSLCNKITSHRHSGNKHLFKNFFAPKAILFVSFYPFRCEHGKILKTIYNYTINNGGKIRKPIEKILENLILETPVPPKGLYSVEYHLFNEKYILALPPPNTLPLVSLEMEKMFSLYKVDQILDIYKHILLEGKVIFFSIEKNSLSNVIESFLSLLYPLKYAYPFISVLPVENFSIIENFNAYVLGVNLKFSESFFKEYNLEVFKNVLIVDLDKKSLFYHSPSSSVELQMITLEELNSSPPVREDVLANIEIPKNQKFKISEKIKNYIREIKLNSNQKEDRENFIKVIRDIFFSFLITTLQEYSKFILNTDKDFENFNQNLIYQTCVDSYKDSYKEMTIYDLFKVEDFLNNSVNSLDKPFYKRLIETKMFYNLIYNKLFPKDNKDKMEIIFLDECIVERNNKRIFSKTVYTPFSNSKLYDLKMIYSVPKSRGFSIEEIEYLKKNMKGMLRYGQEIMIDIENISGYNEMSIIYHMFPKILYDNTFFEQNFETQYLANEIHFRPNLQDEVDNISIELLSNPIVYNIYNNNNYRFNYNERLNYMENYIYLSWVHLFAITFHYCEEEEKPFRFQQLINVFKRLNWIDEETANLIYLSILEFGDDTMAIKIFEILNSKGLINNYTSFGKLVNKLTVSENNRISNLFNIPLKKYTISSRRSNITVIPTNTMHHIPCDPSYEFKKRTFDNTLTFSSEEELTFETEETCMECYQLVNLEALSYDFELMKKDLFWAQCPHCHTYIIPKLGVKLGAEEINDMNYHRVILYSPFYLKQNYTIALLKEFGIKLDVDSFRNRFNALFWNSIWFFSIMQLPFDFILPYKADMILKLKRVFTDQSISPLLIEHKIISNSSILISPCTLNTEIKNFEKPVTLFRMTSDTYLNLQICCKEVDLFIYSEVVQTSSKCNSNSQEILFDFDPQASSFINAGMFLENGSRISSGRNSIKSGDSFKNVRNKIKLNHAQMKKLKMEVNKDLRRRLGFKSLDITSQKNKYKENIEELILDKEE